MMVGIISSIIAFFAYGSLLITLSKRGLKDNKPRTIFLIYLLVMMLLQTAYFGVSIAQNELQAFVWYILSIPFSSAQIIIYFFSNL